VSCIKLKKQTPIGLHFNTAGHSLTNFTILAIEQFGENSEAERRMKEITWQNIFTNCSSTRFQQFETKTFGIDIGGQLERASASRLWVG